MNNNNTEEYKSFIDCVYLTEAMAGLSYNLKNIYFALVNRDYDRANSEIKYTLLKDITSYPEWLKIYILATNKEAGRTLAIENFITTALGRKE